MVFRNFIGNNFFPVGPPPVKNGDLVGFWPVLGLGHRKGSRAQAENKKNAISRCQGHFGGGIRPPGKFLPEIAQVFYIWLTGPPGAGNRKMLGV